MSTTIISICIDSKVKSDAEELFTELGLNLSTAVNMFLRQSIRERQIPFEVTTQPNVETVAAIEEGRRILRDDSAETFESVSELRAALGL